MDIDGEVGEGVVGTPTPVVRHTPTRRGCRRGRGRGRGRDGRSTRGSSQVFTVQTRSKGFWESSVHRSKPMQHSKIQCI